LYFQNDKTFENNYGLLDTTNAKDMYVPVKIRFGKKNIKAKVRLKGNWIDSRNKNKMSLRIKVKGDNSILNMKTFSLHAPEVKGIMSEWLFHKWLHYENLINLRYFFINLSINGENKGLMAMEEHFDNILLEYNNKRPGIILKIDETQWISEFLNSHEEDKKNFIFDFDDNLYSQAVIESFSNIEINDPLYKQYIEAVTLFEKFRNNELDAEKVFDLEKFSKLFAIAELLGDTHSIESKNIKFYFNPMTSLIEPIGYDQHRKIIKLKLLLPQNRKFFSYNDKILWPYQLRKNEKFYSMYIKNLEKLSNKKYFSDFIKSIESDLNENLNKIYSYYSSYNFDEELNKIYDNQNYIKNILNNKNLLNVYAYRSSNEVVKFKIGNIFTLPIKIIKIKYNDNIFKIENDNFHDLKRVAEKIKYKDYSINLKQLLKNENNKIDFTKFKVVAKIFGTNKEVEIDVNNWPFIELEKEQTSDLKKINFIEVKGNVIKFINKNIVIKNNIKFPPNYKIIIEEGTNIDLINGSQKFPVNITSTDNSGQGLFVISSKEQSVFNHVIFSNISNNLELNQKGAVNIYDSDVYFNNTIFKGNVRGDDLLNIINSKYKIDNSTFYNSNADAFDSDFSDGEILNTIFINIRNDAIDTSQGIVKVENCIFFNIDDKGISAGENSQLYIKNIKIEKANIGIAVKDGSKVFIDGLYILNSKYGLTAYNKKHYFENGNISAINTKINNV